MGSKPCGIDSLQKQQSVDPLALNYGYDDRQKEVDHSQQTIKLYYPDKEIENQLNKYAKALNENRSLYQDITMSYNPVILKSKFHQFNCTYKRPYNFITCKRDQPYRVINDEGCSPNSIVVKDEMIQYFGVFLCFISDKPQIIKSIICTNSNSYGIHCIKANRNGKIVLFFIDDYILCRYHKLKNRPVFSQPQQPGQYMWPCIIEKAWFKIQGNCIDKVEQSRPQQLFFTFQELPIQKYIFDELGQQQRQKKITQTKQLLNKIFLNFNRVDEKNGCIVRSKKKPQYDIGLSGSKYFYLLDILVHDNKRLYYLRNPHAHTHFRGIHDKIPQHFQQRINKKKNRQNKQEIPHGNILLNQQQFIQQINQISIIYYRDHNTISRQSIIFQLQRQFFFVFQLENYGLFNLYLHQYLPNDSKNQPYNPIIYHVIRLNDMKLIGGHQNNQGYLISQHLSLLDKFTQQSVTSKYMIRLKIKKDNNNQNMDNKINLAILCYFRKNVQFKQNNELNKQWQNFLKTMGSRQLLKSFNKKNQKNSQIAHIICWIGDIVFLYIQKKSKQKQVSIQVSFPQLMNLKCISHPQIKKSSDNWNNYKITDNFLIIFQKIDLKAQTYIHEYHLETY